MSNPDKKELVVAEVLHLSSQIVRDHSFRRNMEEVDSVVPAIEGVATELMKTFKRLLAQYDDVNEGVASLHIPDIDRLSDPDLHELKKRLGQTISAVDKKIS